MADEETPALEIQENAPSNEETDATAQNVTVDEEKEAAQDQETPVTGADKTPQTDAPPESQDETTAPGNDPPDTEATPPDTEPTPPQEGDKGDNGSAPTDGDEAAAPVDAEKPADGVEEGPEEAQGGEQGTEQREGEVGQGEGADATGADDGTAEGEAPTDGTLAEDKPEAGAAETIPEESEEIQEVGPEVIENGQLAPSDQEPIGDQQEDKPTSPLPQSDTFAEGERPETPVVAVIQPLSREGSPQLEPMTDRLEAGTPERFESPQEEEDFGEDDAWMVSREDVIEMYQAAQAEREQMQNQNVQLQHKLAEYFKKKKTDDQRQEMDKNITDQEQRYLKYMSNLEELRNQEEDERDKLSQQLEELKERRYEKLDAVGQETELFSQLKLQSAQIAINSRTGKAIAPKDIELYLFNEAKKEEEVKQVRLENIKLRNRLRKREQQLKAKEELAEGLHLIDFEQLKIENQTYNEKIEERNEELLKLRKKITSTVQVLTHVKEKLQFVQAENQVQKGKLKEVESLVAQKRDVLSRTKKARDSLRIDNQRLRQKCGLLGNTPLLRDFEERKDEGEELRTKLERLKRQHAELTLNCSGVRRKIEEARSGRS